MRRWQLPKTGESLWRFSTKQRSRLISSATIPFVEKGSFCHARYRSHLLDTPLNTRLFNTDKLVEDSKGDTAEDFVYEHSWDKRTEQLLGSAHSIGSTDDNTLVQAYDCLNYWLSQDTPNMDAARNSAKLVHLIGSLGSSTLSSEDAGGLTPAHLNRLIYHYYTATKARRRRRGNKLPSPTQLLTDIEKLCEQQQCDSDLLIDLKTYNMLMAGARLAGEPKDVETLLRHLQQHEHLKPDLVSFNTAISAWNGHKGGPGKARALFDELRQHDTLQPDAASYGALMAAYAKAGDSENAMNLLAEMRESNLRPNIKLYGALLDALAKTGQPVKAEKVLTDMESSGVLPNSVCYDTVLGAYHRNFTKDSVLHMERILKLMKERYEAGHVECRPTQYSYGVLVAAWAKSRHTHAAHRAQQLVNEMHELAEQGHLDSRPGVAVYNSLMSAHGRHPDIQAALKVWNHVKHEYAKGIVAAKPDWMSYNILIDAWSLSQRVDAPERAEELLDEMKQLSANGDTSVKPINSTYTALMTVWTRCGGSVHRGRAADRCQALFEELLQLYQQSGDRELRPNSLTYGALLSACVDAKQPERAEDILKHMVADYRDGNIDAQPNTATFNNVLTAWARSEQRHSPDRAQALLSQMRQLHDEHGWRTKPDSVSIASLLSCWAYSKQTGAAQEAERLFRQFQSTSDMPITRSWYTSVMSAWANSGERQASERVQALFDEMKSRYQQGDTHLKPTSACYTPLLTVLSRSRQRDAPDKTQAVFDEMVAAWQAGDAFVRPTSVQYAALINSYAQVGRAEEAERILYSMYEEVSSGRNPVAAPNKHCFGSVLAAYSRSGLAIAPERAQHVLDRMMEDFRLGVVKEAPEETHFTNLITVWARTGRPEAGKEAEEILQQMENLAKTKGWDCYPSVGSYSIAMRAWNESGLPDSFKRAEALFVKLVELAKENRVRLDSRAFSIFLHGLTQSDVVDKRSKLQATVQLMRHMGIDPDRAIQKQVRRMLDSSDFQP